MDDQNNDATVEATDTDEILSKKKEKISNLKAKLRSLHMKFADNEQEVRRTKSTRKSSMVDIEYYFERFNSASSSCRIMEEELKEDKEEEGALEHKVARCLDVTKDYSEAEVRLERELQELSEVNESNKKTLSELQKEFADDAGRLDSAENENFFLLRRYESKESSQRQYKKNLQQHYDEKKAAEKLKIEELLHDLGLDNISENILETF